MAGQFEKTLDQFQQDMSDDKVSMQEILVILNNRGFGALLLLPCIIELLPTGSIPGVPSLCATFIILISLQIVMDRRHPWMPKPIRNATFSQDKFKTGLDKVKPGVRWIDRKTKKRWNFLISHPAERLAALVIIALALTIYPLELMPFASSIPSFMIGMFAVGFLTKDGFLLFITWVLSLGAGIGIGFLLKGYVF